MPRRRSLAGPAQCSLPVIILYSDDHTPRAFVCYFHQKMIYFDDGLPIDRPIFSFYFL